MRHGLDDLQKQKRKESKQKILDYIKTHPGTYFNAIVEALKMSKTTVSECIRILLESKQIIPLKDSPDTEFSELEIIKSKNQLVYYDQTKERPEIYSPIPNEKYGGEISAKQIKDTKQMSYLIAMSKLAKKIHFTVEKLIQEYNKNDKTKKLIESLIPDIEKKIQEYLIINAKISVARTTLDHRIKFGEYEKIKIAHKIKTELSIRKVSKDVGYSTKYGSELSKKYSFDSTDSRFPEFKKMLDHCPKCDVWVAEELLKKIEDN